MKPSERMAQLKISLPDPASPIGSYVPAIRSGKHIFTSGQLPMREGKLVYAGKVPDEVGMESAVEAARIAALSGLAAAAQAAGGVDAIGRILRVCVYVNSSAGFTDQPKVANGASDVLAEIFRDAGLHVRSAVGVAELPLDAPVEVELVVETAH